MAFTPELIDELELLALFNLNNTQEGLKVHHTADGRPSPPPDACRQGADRPADGGYLTSLGLDAAEQAQGLLTILKG